MLEIEKVLALADDREIFPIIDKVLSGERLSFEDGVKLFKSHDLLTIGWLANYVSEKKNGKYAYFVINRQINPTNVCVLDCKFCAFADMDKNSPKAYEMSIEQILEKVRYAVENEACEVHIVGGLHPDWKFEKYLEIVSAIKRNFPDLHIKAFTAVEIDYFSKISGLSYEEVLIKLKEAGLDSLPGGGAEIFSPRVRQIIAPKKIGYKKYLQIHKLAHKMGLKSTTTMLYGHVENIEDRIDHMIKIREAQDETGGFTCFIPLAYQPENNELPVFEDTSGIDDLKTIAISRLMLDNIDHIKAYWVMIGEKVAQVALNFGADDMDGTVMEEKIAHFAGAKSPTQQQKERLIRLIKEAGKIPVQRDTLYNPVKIYE
ncbi:aminofutalosine synthase MqnE [Venenivibrio stagnispumantis]|uniref:Aminodeoxyfutalosine synthase n=1 Tax=Venenivibrio stagnispumantis TaxID=407998 RepID=A0AA46ACN9_9AQUI|nr:aminofutalosine synthase MqnE [Venenivibrio stagnispumantis]MCW4572585.1 aminofutalosine synthase MqnE [Venenivibrio stagnispumantis]SMP00430.1 aminodeoxyfutalosine synthase [Venenivibrio stagnispumantis]